MVSVSPDVDREGALELTTEVVRDEARYEVPAVFVHYVLVRVATDLAGVAAVQDEIDWLGEYLTNELTVRRSFLQQIARQGLKRADVGRAYLPPTHRQIDAYVTATRRRMAAARPSAARRR